MRDVRQGVPYLTALVFRLWADYWTDNGRTLPAITMIREGVDGELFFATGIGRFDLNRAVAAMGDNKGARISRDSDWLLDGQHYFGAWEVFRVKQVR